jgi:hypothetical protein
MKRGVEMFGIPIYRKYRYWNQYRFIDMSFSVIPIYSPHGPASKAGYFVLSAFAHERGILIGCLLLDSVVMWSHDFPHYLKFENGFLLKFVLICLFWFQLKTSTCKFGNYWLHCLLAFLELKHSHLHIVSILNKQRKPRNILMRVCVLLFGSLSLVLFWQLTREWGVLWKACTCPHYDWNWNDKTSMLVYSYFN